MPETVVVDSEIICYIISAVIYFSSDCLPTVDLSSTKE